MTSPAAHVTIAERFLATADALPDKTAFHVYRNGWQRVSYRAFSDEVRSVAAFLAASGIRAGDRVALVAENRPEWCSSYIAILLAGGIAVPIDAQLTRNEVAALLADSDARMVIHSSRTAAQVPPAELLPPKADLLTIDLDSPSFAEARQHPHRQFGTPTAGDDLASLIYTSGTTGQPKGVMLTHRNFCADADAALAAGIVAREDTVLAVLPLHHTYAFLCTFLVPVFVGGSITYPKSIKGPDLLAAVRETGVSVMVCVPQLLGMIRNSIVNKMQAGPRPVARISGLLLGISSWLRRRIDLPLGKLLFRAVHRPFGPSFRFFTSGGARLDPVVMQELEGLGFTVLEGYGLTETAPVVAFNPVRRRKPGSAGVPLPSASIRIARPADDGTGEIEIQGPMVMQGYYRNPAATKAVLHDGWFSTGDIGRIDRDGYLFITGRSKEVIVLNSGKNIYPEDIEKLYGASPLIKELCITGIGQRGITEALHAVVVPDLDHARSAGVANLHEAIKWELNSVSGRLPSYMRVSGFSLRKEPLPRTPLGKLRRFLVRPEPQQKPLPHEAGSPEAAFADPVERDVISALRLLIKDDRQIGPGDNIELDLGLDSLARIELAVALEQSFGLKLPEDFMVDVQSVADLFAKIRQAASGEASGSVAALTWSSILDRDPEGGISLTPPGAYMLPSRIAHAVLRLVAKLYFRLSASGAASLPQQGSFILAPNHASYLDGFVVVLALPFARFRSLYLLGISDFFTGFLKSRFARLAHVIPIDSASYLNRALQTAAYVLRNDRSVCVFPEGGRSPDGSLLEFKKGVGILAVEMGVPVIPVFISGAFEAMPRNAAWPRPRRITVVFGTPLRVADLDLAQKPAAMDVYQYFAAVLRERVRELSGSV